MEPLLMVVLLFGFSVLVLGLVLNLHPAPHEPEPDDPPDRAPTLDVQNHIGDR